MSAASTSFLHELPEPVREVETFSKPGTADVTPSDRKKLAGLLKHYAKMPHPFSACKRDQLKHGLTPDHANRRCAVIKDLIRGTTKWRGKAKEEALDVLAEALDLVQAAAVAMGPQNLAAMLSEERLSEGEADILFAVEESSLTEREEVERAEEVVRFAAALVEAPPQWMIPVAARRPGFRPTKPEKGKGSSRFDESKIRRAGKGTPTGGQFVRKGSTGVEVGAVQQRLGITRTGTYGGNTIKAVKRFQRRHGLQVDGVVGAQTVAAMRGRSGVAPGRLSKNDRRYLRRYVRRTPVTSTSTPSRSRAPIPSAHEDSLPRRRTDRLAKQGWDYHDGHWYPPGHPRNKKG